MALQALDAFVVELASGRLSQNPPIKSHTIYSYLGVDFLVISLIIHWFLHFGNTFSTVGFHQPSLLLP